MTHEETNIESVLKPASEHSAGVVRRMRPADLDQVEVIERSAYFSPWPKRHFVDALALPNYRCLVLEAGPQVSGYCLASVVANEAELLNLCVSSACQSRGFGRQLLTELHHRLVSEAAKIFLEVRRSNAPAIALYQSLAYQSVGVRKDYYEAPVGREDALILACDLSASDDAQAP